LLCSEASAAIAARKEKVTSRQARVLRPAKEDSVQDRRVEITGPLERKMMINALNSGASAFMADFEDSVSPTWTTVVEDT